MEYLYICNFCGEETLYKEKWLANRKAYPCIHCKKKKEKEQSYLLHQKKLLDKGFELINIIEGDHSKKHKVLFKCLSCGVLKEKNLYKISLPSSNYKCNCNNEKKNKTDLTMEEFFWYGNQKSLNKFNFLDSYKNLNSKLLVECKKCKLKSKRWGKEFFKKEIISCQCEIRSNGEQLVFDILKKNKFNFEEQYKISINEHILFMDFFLREYNTFIEYQGQQHYISVKYWGGQEKLMHQQYLDNLKREYCLKNNFKLIEIPYNLQDAEVEELIKNIG